MPLPTFYPPVGPSPGTGYTPTVSLWEADFGDGYSQSTPKGLNHIKKSYSLAWKVLTEDQYYEITDFLEGQQGNKPFWFQPFGAREPMKFTCKEWAPTSDAGLWSITATFVQSFTNQT
jgi:phage-related protein